MSFYLREREGERDCQSVVPQVVILWDFFYLWIFLLFYKYAWFYIRDIEPFFFLNHNISIFLLLTLCPVLQFRCNYNFSNVES